MLHIISSVVSVRLGSLLLLVTLTLPDTRGAETTTLPGQAMIRFAATSTLHDFGGALPVQPFLLVLSNGTWSAEADVRAALMATGNDKRDRNMHRMLNTNAHPLLHGRVVGAPIPSSGAATNATLHLQIAGRALDLPVRVSDWLQSGDEARFHAEWDVSLDEFGLKPPSVLGVIRVGDRVRIAADVTASRTNYPPALPPPKP
jgi:hypothetical protein